MFKRTSLQLKLRARVVRGERRKYQGRKQARTAGVQKTYGGERTGGSPMEKC